MKELNSFYSHFKQENHLQQIHLWHPPAAPLLPTRKKPKTSLRIGCICSEKTFRDLGFEAELVSLRQLDWEQTLFYGNIDLLLIDSFWVSATGEFYLAQQPSSDSFSLLKSIVTCAKKHNIPTVYLNIEDYSYLHLFRDFSLHFDYIYCSDVRVAENLSQEKSNTVYLPPAFQPALYNPFRHWDAVDTFSLNVLFDGWADIFRYKDELDFLYHIHPNDLSIIESNYTVYKAKLKETGKLQNRILGCVGFYERLTALKYAKSVLFAQKSLASETARHYAILEAAACRVPVLCENGYHAEKTCRDISISFSGPKDLQEHLTFLAENEHNRQFTAQEIWRNINLHDTIGHRLDQIASDLNIDMTFTQTPLVSVILPTFRPHLLEKCVEQFDRQTYARKELVLILNGHSISQERLDQLIGSRTDIRLYQLPRDRVEGSCLNFAISSARGEHIIKMDDDDYYSDNFALDMMLHNNATNADVYGKSNCFFYFEDDDTTYQRIMTNRPQLSIIPHCDVVKAHISGNTLSGKTSFFRKHKYSDSNFSSTDTDYHFSVSDTPATYALLDDFGIIMHRSANASNHSWRPDNDKLKADMKVVNKGISHDFSLSWKTLEGTE